MLSASEENGTQEGLTWPSVFSSDAQLHHCLRNPAEMCRTPPAWPWRALGMRWARGTLHTTTAHTVNGASDMHAPARSAARFWLVMLVPAPS